MVTPDFEAQLAAVAGQVEQSLVTLLTDVPVEGEIVRPVCWLRCAMRLLRAASGCGRFCFSPPTKPAGAAERQGP